MFNLLKRFIKTVRAIYEKPIVSLNSEQNIAEAIVYNETKLEKFSLENHQINLRLFSMKFTFAWVYKGVAALNNQ